MALHILEEVIVDLSIHVLAVGLHDLVSLRQVFVLSNVQGL